MTDLLSPNGSIIPPLGWNSFNCYGSSISEEQFKANVDAMAKYLLPHGYQYCVLDYCWSHPCPGAVPNPHQDVGYTPELSCDQWGRLLPAPERFPSCVGGLGLKPLADYVHEKGLKFGLHIMRGVPRQAVFKKLPILGSTSTVDEIADVESTCTWLNHMYGVNMRHPAAQRYYDSLFELYAGWGVDFIKADDLLADHPGYYQKDEIAAIKLALDRCARPMILSLSPGPAPLSQAKHLREHATMWRISPDFWDEWPKLRAMFDLCNAWSPFTGGGRFADADMLPIGRLALNGPVGNPRQARFSRDEILTMLSLWVLFKSPLFFGGDIPSTDPETLSLISNPSLLRILREGINGRQHSRLEHWVTWLADCANNQDIKFVGLFNLSDSTTPVPILLRAIHPSPVLKFTNVWTGSQQLITENVFGPNVPAHGCLLYIVEASACGIDTTPDASL
ncbi:MAG: glycoside hydrolase family 27 protein [Verrucomicrobia bacterium]|nr:glycoside hydrolase family 27 protein [Verrucomicrobiota bacterium]